MPTVSNFIALAFNIPLPFRMEWSDRFYRYECFRISIFLPLSFDVLAFSVKWMVLYAWNMVELESI